MKRIEELATANLQILSRNPYPGRGIILGRTPNDDLVQVYWIMGRSDGSRNRIFKHAPDQHGWLRTRVADESKHSGDPNLLIYTAMAEGPNIFVVSNGAQTDAVTQSGMWVLKNDWQYEPDDPNFTPRITGILSYLPGDAFMSLVMLRKSPFGDGCDRLVYTYNEVAPGYGYFISTYEGDGDPLPPFSGEPLIMPIESNDPAEIAATYWVALNTDNRVALAVKLIPSDGRHSKIAIINRHGNG